MENKKWYVGQQVWDKIVSEEVGEVLQVNNIGICNVIVVFNSLSYTYTLDGILIDAKRQLPTLSTKPYEIIMEGFSQEAEEELPKKGQLVWCENPEGLWFISHFQFKNEHSVYAVSKFNDSKISVSYCHKITTKNPYELEEEVSKMETTDREPIIGELVYAWNEDNMLDIVHDIYSAYGTGLKRVYKVGGKVYKYCSLKNPLKR